MIYTGLINKYRQYLPVSDKTPVITLNEGNTPLIFAPFLSSCIGRGFEVYLKYEGLNPTGSFKDRGMTMAISKAQEEGAKAVICASTGNTSASAAAYAAKAGMRCVVLIPNGHIALGKLSQALIHGAIVLQVDGNFDEALELVKEITAKYPITMVNSLNPFRIEGQKTAAFEIIEALDDAPDIQIMPVGNAGNITAYWKGYKEYHSLKISKTLPKMIGFQAEGAAPIVKGCPIEHPETIATAIRIGNPASWKQAVAARDESKGLIDCVSDEKILDAYKLLALKEGVFAEPASCASIAGLLKLAAEKYFAKLQTHSHAIKIVCILTGHGLKDPDRAIKSIKEPKIVKPTLKAILAEIGY
jgi:threonine synthase